MDIGSICQASFAVRFIGLSCRYNGITKEQEGERMVYQVEKQNVTPRGTANGYEQITACMLYERLCALRDRKAQDLLQDGACPSLAAELAEIYVITTYCDGHPFAVYAVAQARLQLLREGYIPSNASTMPNPWHYNPYTRLSPDYAESVLGLNV